MPNRKNCYKDMNKFLKTRNKQRKKYYNKTSFRYGRRSWTLEEDKQVLLHDMSDTELSFLIHRSVAAIQIRRSVLKKQMAW